MTGPEINDFSRALGSLEASVANLTRTWAEQERNATEGRRALHRKMDDIKDDVGAMTGRVDSLANEVAEISPAVKEFKQQRERAIGAMKFGRWMWGAMLAAAGMVGWAINEWLRLPRIPH